MATTRFPPPPLPNPPFIQPRLLAELSVELSGAICLRTLVLLGSALKLFREFFGAVRAFFGFGVLFWAPDQIQVLEVQDPLCRNFLEKLNRGVSKPGGFPLFSGKVQIVSRTLSGLFLVGAVTNRPRKRKEHIGKIPEESPHKSGTSQKNQESPKKDKKGQKRKDKSRSGNPPV